ncbi:glycoside hydrolase family 32 protein [Actinomyces faecalis]|uniref:glycoside hydrolase family 32 protein n=1 Tax=Actinomyces faecalis TaxID=2722820 RepID=UPI001557A26F|nr:glycoside hydrolase family 32 protein [Actinomyces faecalis]
MTEDLRAAAAEAVKASRAADDPDYPLIHVAPPVGRLNDPNGLLIDDGVAHVFFQYTPMHGSRRLVYWGHATSRDMLHWVQHEPAIVPDSFYDANGAYSGNALVLEDDERATAPHEARYQLFYTGNLKDEATGERTASQCLVTSQDLLSFTKLSSNPLIATHAPGYTAHFRDPQVTRDPEAPGTYRMLLGVQRTNETGAALLYRSTDMLSWHLDGEMTFPDADGCLDTLGFMWECPGLVRLTDEVTGQEQDVLIWCPQGARPEGPGYENVFPCVYAVGRLTGNELRQCDGTVHEVDRGFEFYAPQVFARRPSQPGPPLLMGWVGNAGQDDQPSTATGGWVHTLTVPRTLSLRAGRLIQRPLLPEPAALPLPPGQERGEALRLLAGHRTWHLVLCAEESTGTVEVRIGSEADGVVIELDAGQGFLRVDRSATRYTHHGARRTVEIDRQVPPRLEVVHDRSVTEVFVGDGDLAFSMRSFIDPAADGATVTVWDGARLLSAQASVFD